MTHPTRRRVLVSIPALALAAACRPKGTDTAGDTGLGATPAPAREPEPDDWAPEGDVDEGAFPFGVQVGDATNNGARLSVHTAEKSITLVVAMASDGAWVEVDRRESMGVSGGFLQLDLDGLTPDTAWSVVIYGSSGRSRVARFRSATDDSSHRVVTFGASSCFGGNEPWPTLSHAAAEKLDFFCLLGDTVYADGSVSTEDYDMHWQHSMRQPGMKDLCASTSLIVTWDDHEIDNNWLWTETSRIDEKFVSGLERFNAYLPHSTGQGTAGLWRKLSWGAVLDVFVLECRAERQPDQDVYISAEQMDWLKAGLSGSRARFKIILNSVPITDLYTLFSTLGTEDRWEGYTEQRTEILSHIVDGGIGGVLWIAGDIHLAAVARIDRAGGVAEDMHEVIAGPGGSFLNFAADLAVNLDREQIPIIFAEWNYTRFACDPGTGIVSVQFVGDDGSVLAETDLQL